ncbi:MAG TPA: helix-turn-helix domain-containing protein [Pseudonocardiaceae bacterium]|nr:helix-turn-helix domain-containing protein [Pseudonocardiaceae bacterium]
MPVQTIYDWRTRRYGPTGRKVGRHIRYEADEVKQWLESLNEAPEGE